MTAVPTEGRARPHVSTTWANTVLRGLGITPNGTNVFALRLWHASEGNNAPNQGYNWLNTTVPMKGSHTLPGNGAGVQIYPNYATGVAATVKSLKGSQYTGVLRALSTRAATRTGHANRAVLAKIFDAINSSPWDGKWNPTPVRAQYPDAMFTYLNTGSLPGGVSATQFYQTTGISASTKAKGNSSTCPCAWNGPLSFCILNECQMRALKGALLVTAGAGVLVLGMLLLAANGFGSKAAAAQLGKVRRRTGGTVPSSAPAAKKSAPAPRRTPQERQAEKKGLATGAETSAGRQIKTNEWDVPFTAADETLPPPTKSATRRANERRPRARASH